jgi:fermentation-respiration switch protein FrsA (DUF1100 family)
MAAYAASVQPPDGVILESGFKDARSLMRGSLMLAALSIFSTYRFQTAEWLKAVDRPVLVMHGDNDRVIPFDNGQRLFNAISGRKELVVIRGGDHNDLQPPDPDAYWAAIDSFISGLRAQH